MKSAKEVASQGIKKSLDAGAKEKTK